jgi:hypothetical protein
MVFGFAILISSAWFLHLGRFAGYDIEYFLATLALLSMHIGLYDHPNSRTRWYLWIVVNILLLTIPGMVWLVLLSTAWQWSTLRKAWSQSTLTHRLSLLALLLAGGGSLAATFIHNSRLLTSWAGISDFNMRILRDLPAKLWENILAIGVHGQSQPELWLKGMPMLDFFLLGMLIIGAAFYIRHWQANRARLLAALLTLSLLLASLGVVSLSIIAPLLYLIVVAGTAYILHFWLHTFPRNPLARTAGIGVITALVALSCFFNLTSYFVAWPHNPETIRAYHLTQ